MFNKCAHVPMINGFTRRFHLRISISSQNKLPTAVLSICKTNNSWKIQIFSTPQSYYRSYDEYIPISASPVHQSQVHTQSPQQHTPSSVSNSIPHSPSMHTSSSPSMNQYGYSSVIPTAIITSHQDVHNDNQQWNCGGGMNGSTNLSSYQTEFCASNYSIMQRQQYGAKIGPGASMKSIKEARIRRPMNGELKGAHFWRLADKSLWFICSLHGVGKSGTQKAGRRKSWLAQRRSQQDVR